MLCHVTFTWQLVVPIGDVLPESSSPKSFGRSSVFDLRSLTNRWNTSPLWFAIRTDASSARWLRASASAAARWFAAFCCSIHSVLIKNLLRKSCALRLAPAKCKQTSYAEENSQARHHLRRTGNSGLGVVGKMLTVELEQVIGLAGQTKRPLHYLLLLKPTA